MVCLQVLVLMLTLVLVQALALMLRLMFVLGLVLSLAQAVRMLRSTLLEVLMVRTDLQLTRNAVAAAATNIVAAPSSPRTGHAQESSAHTSTVSQSLPGTMNTVNTEW